MRSIPVLIGAALLITNHGLAETLITAQDYAVDSDVVLESTVDTVKSIPQDAVNVVGDAVKYAGDEVVTALNGAAAVFKGDPVAAAEKAGVVEIASAWDSSNDIIFRSFKISPNVGDELAAGGMEDDATAAVDVRGYFEGIKFPAGASAYYRPEFNRLFVRQTLGNVLAIEDVLAELHNTNRELMGHQVEIQTKFVEVSQKTMDELGFSWRFNSKGTDGDASLGENFYLPNGQDVFASGLRTAATALSNPTDAGLMLVSKTTGSLQWDMMISALEQSDDADVLCAPRVVTRDGNTATIKVGEQQQIPKAFDINHSDTSPYVEHTDWDLEQLGVQLEVTPELREGDLIDLEISPRIWDIVGYDTYDVVPQYRPTSSISNNTTKASLPYIRVREVTTAMTVADGSTVGMGGLVYNKLETFRDKVPVLGSIPYIGRLFRSEGERSVKRNLMIFVTASQVDVNGRKAADLALSK
jgi:general secretion pathway protein D